MSKSPTKSMTRIMQEKPAKAMAETKAKRRTNRWAPRRARKYRPCKHQAHGKKARRRLFKTGPAAQECQGGGTGGEGGKEFGRTSCS